MLKGKVFIGTPTYRRNVVNDYCLSLVRDTVGAAAQMWYAAPPHFVDDTLIHFGRNKLVDAFLATDYDYLVMIDSDLGWEEGGLMKLLDTPGDIVGALYRGKCENHFYPVQGDIPQPVEPYWQVDAVPTGFMKISRKTCHIMKAYYPRPFQFTEGEGGEWGEDFTFCARATHLKLSVVARNDIEFTHVGMHGWTGKFSEDVEKGNVK